jgi:uncharacterized protein (TIGR02598 family)
MSYRSHAARAAFSLVEVALAVGIVAFAFVSLMALLPVGLSHFRAAIDLSVGAQIFQHVVGDAEQEDFERLTTTTATATGDFFVLPTRYFDDQGGEVVLRTPGTPSADEAAQIVYQVRVRGSRPGPDAVATQGAEVFTSLPASPGALRFNLRDATFLTIQIAHLPGGGTLPVDARLLWKVPASRSLPLATYSAVVTRNGFSRPPTP